MLTDKPGIRSLNIIQSVYGILALERHRVRLALLARLGVSWGVLESLSFTDTRADVIDVGVLRLV